MRRMSVLLLPLLIFALLAQAQDTTPEATETASETTAEATVEATPEPTDVSDGEATPETTDALDNCPTLVRTAIDLTQQSCQTTQVNEACYGHILLEAETRVASTDFDFDSPGDIVDLITIESLQLSAMDVLLGQWGVMLLEIEANVRDLLENSELVDDVQLLLFGDAQLTDASQFVPVIVETNLRVRRQPTTNSEIVDLLDAGERVIANAQLADGSWLRIRTTLDDGVTELGWIAADFVSPEGDLDILSALTPEEAADVPDDLAATYGPMQAFFFQSDVDDAPCEEAPNSGLLVQTPEGVASVTLWMDEVVIQMNGTGFVQAEPGGNLTVNVIDGIAEVEANGDSRTAVGGTAISVPLDAELSPEDVPGAPELIDPDDVQSLPFEALDDEVQMAAAPALPQGQPLAGQWRFTWGAPQLTCPDGSVVPFATTAQASALQTTEDSLTYGGVRYSEVSTGVYTANYVDAQGSFHQDTLRVLGFDLIVGEKVLDLVTPVCTLDVSFRLQLVGTDG